MLSIQTLLEAAEKLRELPEVPKSIIISSALMNQIKGTLPVATIEQVWMGGLPVIEGVNLPPEVWIEVYKTKQVVHNKSGQFTITI